MHELLWIMIFWSQVRWFANGFQEWRSHKWKLLANHLTSDFVTPENHWQITWLITKSSLFTLTNVLFYFLHANMIHWTHHFATKKHRSLILLTTVFSDLTLWHHHNWPVTSREREALTLWCYIHRLFLHVQIGAKAIFTSEYHQWISISHHPVFTA